eukprot:GHVU01133130.1.p2 GENE.GHVU01133130.1~~GHVU01133130.1.p2  ORF type:complete len:113 (+),score=19.04 GHVU01133130.1:449-787(+)
MKVLGIVIARWDGNDAVRFLNTAHDLSQFSLMEKGAVKEGCMFLARTVVPKLETNTREQIAHEDYLAFCQRFSDRIAVIFIADDKYPPRLAFQCVNRVHDAFREKVNRDIWI